MHILQRSDVAGASYKREEEKKEDVARALFRLVDVNREIPPDLYKAVAEILLFVYNLRNSQKPSNIKTNKSDKNHSRVILIAICLTDDILPPSPYLYR